MKHPTQLSARESGLLVIDVQEKLMVKIPGADAVTRNIAFLLDAARLLDVEIAAFTRAGVSGARPSSVTSPTRIPLNRTAAPTSNPGTEHSNCTW